jgi:hypothetical protein
MKSKYNTAPRKEMFITPLCGRASSETAKPQQSTAWTPPTADEVVKVKRLANNGLEITRKALKTDKKDHDEPDYDENMTINWDKLERDRKRKPCVKLLKRLKKGT